MLVTKRQQTTLGSNRGSEILKHDWIKYKDFLSFEQPKFVIRQFTIAYNTQRYHGAVGLSHHSGSTLAKTERS